MDRLTTHDPSSRLVACRANCESWDAIYDRLAAYEDTGLEPEEINKWKEALSKLTNVTGDRLLEIANAESENRLIVLPCKVGDTVWRIVGPKGHRIVRQRKVLAVTIYHTGDVIIHTDGAENRFGKTVFLTREEAEAALGGGGA